MVRRRRGRRRERASDAAFTARIARARVRVDVKVTSRVSRRIARARAHEGGIFDQSIIGSAEIERGIYVRHRAHARVRAEVSASIARVCAREGGIFRVQKKGACEEFAARQSAPVQSGWCCCALWDEGPGMIEAAPQRRGPPSLRTRCTTCKGVSCRRTRMPTSTPNMAATLAAKST